MPRLLSVNVGLPRDIMWRGKTVRTAIWKTPVEGWRMVRRLNIDGDGQGDLHGHGGEHRAVFVYQIDSYRYWQSQLGRNDFTYGQFGENFTIDGLCDEEVCIGDRYRVGGALLEVTQPRVTCYRVGIRMNEPKMPALLVAHERSGGATTGNAGLTAASGPPPAWPGFRPLRVSRKVRESKNVVSLVLEPADGRALTATLPGQFIAVRLRSAPDAPALMRSYSLSGRPSAEQYRVSVKREAHGAAGAYIDETLQVGDVVDASAARGGFTLLPGGVPVVLLSGGIGATPVLSMLHALAAEPSAREVWWIHGARDGYEHAFAEETRTLVNTLPHGHSHIHIRYSSPAPEDRLGVDFDAPGRLNVQVLRELGVPRNGDFYICGPTTFMSDLAGGLAAWGVAPGRIHNEIFGAGPSITPGIAASPHRPPHLPPGPPGAGPLVSFARSGLNVRWGSTFQSLLELAEACDVPVRWSCRTGVCHTCETGLVAGRVGYRPDPVDVPANGNVLICCSEPEGDIVIDL